MITRFTGHHMLGLMVTFFGIVIAVNITMASLATSTFSGLLVKNGYVASIDYADRERAVAVAAANGWTVTTAVSGGSLSIRAVDKTGARLPLSEFAEAAPQGAVLRPRALTLTPTPDGATTPLPDGAWAVRFAVGEGATRIHWHARATRTP
ncbi:MAG: FixH family protein [Pseudomonadota bacterium]